MIGKAIRKVYFIFTFFLITITGFAQEVQRITQKFETSDGIYGYVTIATKPMAFSGGSIWVQQDGVTIEGINYKNIAYSGNQLSRFGILFPVECDDCYFYASGTVSMLLPGYKERFTGRFEKGGTVHKGGFLKTNQEVIFSQEIKDLHNANLKNGSSWEKTGRFESIVISDLSGATLEKIKNAAEKIQ